jgi:hypothetical protein
MKIKNFYLTFFMALCAADGSPTPNNGLLYTGNPSDPAGWSEIIAGNTPGKRAGLASYGPFRLDPGAHNELIAAYFYTCSPGATPVQNVQSMYDQVGILHQAFDNCFEGLDPTCDEAVPASGPHLATGLSLYPNPATSEFILESRNNPLQSIVLSDLTGRTITSHLPPLTSLTRPAQNAAKSSRGCRQRYTVVPCSRARGLVMAPTGRMSAKRALTSSPSSSLM